MIRFLRLRLSIYRGLKRQAIIRKGRSLSAQRGVATKHRARMRAFMGEKHGH